jgi:hypothetical protein
MNHLPIEMGEESERRRQAYFDAELRKKIMARKGLINPACPKPVAEPKKAHTKKKKRICQWLRYPKKTSEEIDNAMQGVEFIKPSEFMEKLGHNYDEVRRFVDCFKNAKKTYLKNCKRTKTITKGFKGACSNRYYYNYEIKDLKYVYEMWRNQMKVK